MYDSNNDMNLWERIADTLWTLSWYNDYADERRHAEQYETFSKQDAETEKEIQNNMEILLKHQVGYEKNFHTE